ncbi:cytochrome b561 and DOMON domain-containing protein [Dorcoceras hygrometricum]|uniref:Cytochrome b561 and DOMON domain-containing protein n=1 Tax=Dorcoceras hygrometricum TaxID=472368 RepID=A0A2Z7AN12_9LAMI|nr:cytochrome b561 and DOMON domain-containing protein [Dorcoceras hygrometricum]
MNRKISMKTLVFSSFFTAIFLLGSSNAQSCSFSFPGRSYATCVSLPVLNSFLHWTYHESNRTVDLAYRHTQITASKWVVWALNPSGGAMAGAQCLVAFTNSSGGVQAYTSPIPVPGYTNTQLEQGQLSFQVPRLSAEFGGNQMTIFSTIVLPDAGTRFTQVWQHGDVSGNRLLSHPQTQEHQSSFGSIDFSTGVTSGTGASIAGSRQRRRNVHGVLNVVSWGILIPIGAMTARYLKVFKAANPAWFYLHAACQTSAYIVGVAGWGTGLKLGSDSPGVVHSVHRKIGITLFVLGTLQVFALLLRPKPDHKYRIYWNMYHIGIGYSVIILSIINIFEGFDLLDPEKKWKRAYIGILIFLGANAAILEALTWFIVIKRKKPDSDKYSHSANGINGSSGYGA